jgi:hypothetical protein
VTNVTKGGSTVSLLELARGSLASIDFPVLSLV